MASRTTGSAPTLGDSAKEEHRVALEFDGGSLYARLLCPESGCVGSTTCAACGRDFTDSESKSCYDCRDAEEWHNECWVKTWVDNEGADLLQGQIEFRVDPEWNGDHCVLHISDALSSKSEPS